MPNPTDTPSTTPDTLQQIAAFAEGKIGLEERGWIYSPEFNNYSHPNHIHAVQGVKAAHNDQLRADVRFLLSQVETARRETGWLKAPDKYVTYCYRPFVIERNGRYWLVFRDGAGFLHYWNNDFAAPVQCVDTDWDYSAPLPQLPAPVPAETVPEERGLSK